MKVVHIPDDIHHALKVKAAELNLFLNDLVAKHLRDAVEVYSKAARKK